MQISRSLTVPLALFASFTLSIVPTATTENVTFPSYYYAESAYQTTSLNSIAKKYVERNPRTSALQLFGIQSNFSPDEQRTYQSVLSQKSKKIGINIFNLFTR